MVCLSARRAQPGSIASLSANRHWEPALIALLAHTSLEMELPVAVTVLLGDTSTAREPLSAICVKEAPTRGKLGLLRALPATLDHFLWKSVRLTRRYAKCVSQGLIKRTMVHCRAMNALRGPTDLFLGHLPLRLARPVKRGPSNQAVV